MPAFTPSLWGELIEGQTTWSTFANEAMVAAATLYMQRPIVVIQDAQVTIFAHVPIPQVVWDQVIRVRLHAQHYQVCTSRLEETVISRLIEGPSQEIPSLLGGARPSAVGTWNVGSLMLHKEEILEQPHDILCLQETRLTARQQKRLEFELESTAWSGIYLGADPSWH